jgi:hypothetical protein
LLLKRASKLDASFDEYDFSNANAAPSSNERAFEAFVTMISSKTAILIFVVLLTAILARAQSEVPIVSGGAGFIGTTQGGVNFFEPTIAPVIAVPLGDHILIEGRATFQEFVARTNGTSGPYQGSFFDTADYLQLDYTVNSRLTFVVGRFLTPFNIYDERLNPIWIHNLQDVPIIFVIGTRTGGSNDGVMVRGALIARDNYEVNYTAYYSASNLANNADTHFGSARAAGGRAGIFFTKKRLELGASYQRYMQDTYMNASGAYVSWQPYSAPLDVKGEYAHSLSGHGYWLEGAYRLSRFGGSDSAIGRLAPVARMQQFFRNRPVAGDSLPRVNTQQFDFGLNYYLPHEIRLNGSYGRQFTSLRNENVWNFAITYRFMFPMWPGGSK